MTHCLRLYFILASLWTSFYKYKPSPPWSSSSSSCELWTLIWGTWQQILGSVVISPPARVWGITASNHNPTIVIIVSANTKIVIIFIFTLIRLSSSNCQQSVCWVFLDIYKSLRSLIRADSFFLGTNPRSQDSKKEKIILLPQEMKCTWANLMHWTHDGGVSFPMFDVLVTT